MGDATGISWTEATWNPWMGCTRVSAGCDRCYMFTEQRRYGHDPETVRRSRTRFDAPLRWHEPKLVFTCSWSDWFHVDADPWRDEAWEIVRRCPQHTFQILTKRPGRIARHLPTGWGEGWSNVWLGVSVETDEFVSRVRVLRDVPAALRFISAEPLLGPLPSLDLGGIGWVITGGESGPGHRPINPGWVREIRDACLSAGVSFHHKQWGGMRPKSNGKSVDGREWCEIPGRSQR
jgi:protein gp37